MQRPGRPAAQGYGKITARATDLETWVSRATKVVQVERAGRALVDAGRLLAVVKEMTSDAVSLEASEGQVVVRGGRAVFKLLAMRPADFPPFPAATEAEPFPVGAVALRRMVSQTVFAASRANSQYARAAVLFDVRSGTLALAATDARRLAEARCRVESGVTAAAMVPSSMAKMIPRMLAEASAHCC